MLLFLLIKYFTVSTCELFGRVKVVRDITIGNNLFILQPHTERCIVPLRVPKTATSVVELSACLSEVYIGLPQTHV